MGRDGLLDGKKCDIPRPPRHLGGRGLTCVATKDIRLPPCGGGFAPRVARSFELSALARSRPEQRGVSPPGCPLTVLFIAAAPAPARKAWNARANSACERAPKSNASTVEEGTRSGPAVKAARAREGKLAAVRPAAPGAEPAAGAAALALVGRIPAAVELAVRAVDLAPRLVRSRIPASAPRIHARSR
jgi:hypothetical protein